MARKTIVICTSAAFYEHANKLAVELEEMGYKVEVPTTAIRMKKAGNYNTKWIKTWYERPEDVHLKQDLALEHFNKVAKSDAILIINDDKPGKPQYIGPNTTMEWGLAYYLKKPVFILYGVSKDHNYYEEVLGMTTEILEGDLNKIKL